MVSCHCGFSGSHITRELFNTPLADYCAFSTVAARRLRRYDTSTKLKLNNILALYSVLHISYVNTLVCATYSIVFDTVQSRSCSCLRRLRATLCDTLCSRRCASCSEAWRTPTRSCARLATRPHAATGTGARTMGRRRPARAGTGPESGTDSCHPPLRATMAPIPRPTRALARAPLPPTRCPPRRAPV